MSNRNRPLTAATYIGGTVGEPLPQMPLLLTRENYIHVPLESTYMAAWEDVPGRYQEVLLGRS